MATDTIEVNVCGYQMEVRFDYWKAYRGERERGTGLQLEPDEPAGMEVTGIKLLDPEDMMEIISEEVTITLDDVTEAIDKARELVLAQKGE